MSDGPVLSRRTPAEPLVVSAIALQDGWFTGFVDGLSGDGHQWIDLMVGGAVAGRAELTPDPDAPGTGRHELAAAVPTSCLSDGISTVVFHLQPDKVVLASYPIRSGDQLAGDLAADLAVLRGEVAALKQAFMAEALFDKIPAIERPLIVAEAVDAVMRRLDADDDAAETAASRPAPVKTRLLERAG
ncbi:MAG: hypothetical protein AAGJ28_12230 [Pseudomonadota bacterium]